MAGILRSNTIVQIGNAALLLLVALVVFLLFLWRDSLALLAAIIGASSGWIAGIVTSPTSTERAQFADYSRLISGFVAGYLASKIDRIVEMTMDEKRGPLILNQIIARRFLVGIASFLIALLIVFVARQYYGVAGQSSGKDS